MIFVTVGTAKDPFDRLLRAVDGLHGDERLVVQCGPSSIRPARSTCVDFMPFEDVMEHMDAARLVVAHGGVGSVMASLSKGKRPIVVPRTQRFGEAVDDHQIAFVRRLAEQGLVTGCEDPAAVSEAISAHEDVPIGLDPESALARELSAIVDDLILRNPRASASSRTIVRRGPANP